MRALHVFWRSHAHAVRTHPYMPVAKVLPHCDRVHVWNTLAKPWWTHIFTLMRAVSSCGGQSLRYRFRPWLAWCRKSGRRMFQKPAAVPLSHSSKVSTTRPASSSSSTTANTSTTAAHDWHNSIITAVSQHSRNTAFVRILSQTLQFQHRRRAIGVSGLHPL